MLFCTLAYSLSFINSFGNKSNEIFWPIYFFGLASLFGWPFSAFVGIPFFLNYLISYKSVKVSTHDYVYRFIRFLYTSAVAACIILIPMVIIDSSFYNKPSFITWNIVHYNVINADDVTGPSIFGTEPSYFYFLNGFLNFNIVFVLAILAAPILLFSYFFSYDLIVSNINILFLASSNGNPYLKLFLYILPVYMWLLIFTAQPHKEERFLFVIYPLLALNASLSISFLRRISKRLTSKILWFRRFSVFKLFTAIFLILSLSRIIAIQRNFSSFTKIYDDFFSYSIQNLPSSRQYTLCLSEEWYRYKNLLIIDFPVITCCLQM
jgi:alpha-1,2-mannosyltransferase